MHTPCASCRCLYACGIGGVNASNYDAQIDGIYYELKDSVATVVSGNEGEEYEGDITIPSSITYEGKTYKVAEIGKSAFWGCISLAKVKMPSTVATIGENAFGACYSLTSINIPEGVTTIGENAFRGCSGLTSINIPKGITEISSGAFHGCI